MDGASLESQCPGWLPGYLRYVFVTHPGSDWCNSRWSAVVGACGPLGPLGRHPPEEEDGCPSPEVVRECLGIEELLHHQPVVHGHDHRRDVLGGTRRCEAELIALRGNDPGDCLSARPLPGCQLRGELGVADDVEP